ncbi:MAG: hypothetical protein ABI947_08495 [Chloroflexota bacterium]
MGSVRQLALPAYQAKLRHALYYVEATHTAQADFTLLREEYSQIRAALRWLMDQANPELSNSLLTLIGALAPYLRASALHSDLQAYCEAGLRLVASDAHQAGQLRLLRAESYFASGKWSQALSEARLASHIAKGDDLPTYARALLAIGQMEINAGQYRAGLRVLTEAPPLSDSTERLGRNCSLHRRISGLLS